MKTLFKKLGLGNITNIELIESSQNKAYKVTTIDNSYLLKEYSKDAIKNEQDLITRKKQIEISKIFNNSGILTILPIEFNDTPFINYKNKYYLIYNYIDYQVLTEDKLTTSKIIKLSQNLANIHKLSLQYDLIVQYKKINIDIDYYINKFKNKEYIKKLYKSLIKNKKELTNLIKNCNDKSQEIKKHLCISHNDYKLKNILWNNEKMYLIDFDATSLSNPTVSLAESAFALSKQGNILNLDFYRTYITSYLKMYKQTKTTFENALAFAMNGKLQWLEYLLNNCGENTPKRVEESISMIDELILFIKNKDKMLKIYNEIINTL